MALASLPPSSSPSEPNTDQVREHMDLVRSRIPDFDDDAGLQKREYLTYRVFDFGVYDSAKLAGVQATTVRAWRRNDDKFAAWEQFGLPQLQTNIAAKIVQGQFYRNMWLAMAIDAKVLIKANIQGMEKLTTQEKDYLSRIRRMYGPDGLINMMKAVEGDLSGAPLGGNGVPSISVTINETVVTNIEARQAAAMQLLGLFTVQHGDVIEGESRVIEPDSDDGNGN